MQSNGKVTTGLHSLDVDISNILILLDHMLKDNVYHERAKATMKSLMVALGMDIRKMDVSVRGLMVFRHKITYHLEKYRSIATVEDYYEYEDSLIKCLEVIFKRFDKV